MGPHTQALRRDRDSRLPAWPMDPSQAQIFLAKVTSRPKLAPWPTHARCGPFPPASTHPLRTSPSDSHSRKSPPVIPAERVGLWISLIPYMIHNIKALDNMCSCLLFLLFFFFFGGKINITFTLVAICGGSVAITAILTLLHSHHRCPSPELSCHFILKLCSH